MTARRHALALALGLFLAAPAAALEYTVEGSAPVRVSVDDDLLSSGVIAASLFYALPLLVSGVELSSTALGGRPLNNAATGMALSLPPLVGGVLRGQHYLDEMEAQDAREGWATLPAMLMWGASAGQVIGLLLIGGAFVTATRTPLTPTSE